MDEQGYTHVTENACRLDRARRRVRRDAGVERLARVHRGGERTHRLLERRLRVGAVVIEDVDVIETQPVKRLVKRGEDVLARAQVAVGARPHVPARLARDDEFIAQTREVLGQDAPHIDLRGAVRRAVVIGQVEVRDAEIECRAQHVALGLEGSVVPEVVPAADGDCGQQQAAAATPPVGHATVVAVRIGCVDVSHGRESATMAP